MSRLRDRKREEEIQEPEHKLEIVSDNNDAVNEFKTAIVEEPLPEEIVRTNSDPELSVHNEETVEEESPEDIIVEHEEEIQETEGNTDHSPNGANAVHETSKEKKVEQSNTPVITNEVAKEEITPPTKKKIYEDVALIGNTIECRDFRAICKKNNWTIKDKLTEIISKWNGLNYNI